MNTRSTSIYSRSFVFVALTLGLWTAAFAGPAFEPHLPSVSTWELAEQARVRPLTASEVTTVSGNWFSNYIYLEAALQDAMLRGNGSTYLRLPSRPVDRCLNAAMFDLIPAVEDGVLTNQELDALWNVHGGLAYLAHQIGTAGGDSEHLRARHTQAGFIPEGIRWTVVGVYYDMLAREPGSVEGKVDLITRETEMDQGLGVARLIELGSPARDVLWARLNAPAPTPGDTRLAQKRRALFVQAVMTFGAVNDTRIHVPPSQNLPFAHDKTLQYVEELKTRQPGQRDLRHERPVLIYEQICWFHRYGATTP